MSEGTILVIEDDADIRNLLHFNLEKEGFTSIEAGDGVTGLAMAREQKPSLVLLDLMLPGMDGFEVCRRLGSSPDTAEIPVLMLRVRAVLRRRKRPENGPVERHGIRLDPEAHRVISEGKEVALTATEFRLLEDLMRHAGAVRSREQLLDNVWGYTFEGYARTVDTHMRRLRSKLGESQKFLETVRGVGYRFKD